MSLLTPQHRQLLAILADHQPHCAVEFPEKLFIVDYRKRLSELRKMNDENGNPLFRLISEPCRENAEGSINQECIAGGGKGRRYFNMTVNTHNLVVDFVRHKGELWTRLPISYLKWLINAGTQWANIAQSKLDRRGIVTPTDLEISGHALDRASLNCFKEWKTTRRPDEGIHACLYRMATEALNKGELEGAEGECRIYAKMKFVYQFEEAYPTLKTVILTKTPFQ